MPALILIVEDNTQIQQALIDIIEVTGYSVLLASTEFRALELVEVFEEISLIICDIHLHGYNDFSGLIFVKALRTIGVNIPVLLQSADARPTTRAATEVYGKLILKPFGATELIEAIKEVLGDATRSD